MAAAKMATAEMAAAKVTAAEMATAKAAAAKVAAAKVAASAAKMTASPAAVAEGKSIRHQHRGETKSRGQAKQSGGPARHVSLHSPQKICIG